MRHIRELTRNGVRLYDVPFIILIPRLVDNYKIAVHVTVGKAVQVHKHAILIRRDVPAVLIEEVQNNFPIIVHSIVIHPIAGNQLQALTIIEDVTGQLLAVLPTSRMEIDEEIDDTSQEVLGRVLEERFRTAFLLAAFVQGFQQCGCCL